MPRDYPIRLDLIPRFAGHVLSFFLRNFPPHGEIAGRRPLIGPVSCRGGAKRRDR